MHKFSSPEVVIYIFLKDREWIPTHDIMKFRGKDEPTRRLLIRMEAKGLLKSKYTQVQTVGGKQIARVWKIK